MFKPIPRYVLVGAFCAGLYNAIMIAGDWARLHYVVSTIVAFVLIVVVGYVLHCKFTFSEPLSLRGFGRYTVAMLVTLPLSIGGMFVLRDLIHLPMVLASPTLTVLLFAWNYLATHWAVVTRKLGSKPDKLDQVVP